MHWALSSYGMVGAAEIGVRVAGGNTAVDVVTCEGKGAFGATAGGVKFAGIWTIGGGPVCRRYRVIGAAGDNPAFISVRRQRLVGSVIVMGDGGYPSQV